MSTVRHVHLGVVTDVDDPEQRGRIKVACASLMGLDASDEAREYPNWIEPSFGWRTTALGAPEGGAVCGFFFVPGVGTTIELEITESSDFDQSPGQSSIAAPDPRYRGCLVNAGESIGDEFKTNYPARFGWLAPNGATFYFDPTEGSEQITIQSHEIDGARSFFLITSDGSMYLATATGILIVLNVPGGNVQIIDSYGNVMQTVSDGFNLISNKGPVVMAKGANVSILAGGQVLLNAGHVELSAGSVNLGASAVEAVIKGNTFQGLFNAHTHNFVGNLGVPAVTLTPTVPLTGTELSTVTKTE